MHKIKHKIKKIPLVLLLAALICASFLVLPGFDYSRFAKPADMEWIYSGELAAGQSHAVKFTAVGDLMVHSRQAEDALKKGGDTYDYNYAFSYVKKYFRNSDIVSGNLETVLDGRYNDYPNFSVTDEYPLALKNAGFTLLSTANNHSLDQREGGLLRTLGTLDAIGFDHTGTFASDEERSEILTVEENGVSFAILSYTYSTNGIPIPEGKDYLVNMIDRELIAADIARAKELNPDFIVVFPHMGNEYETYTRQAFKDDIMFMFNSGADIVLASHPHVLQPCEIIRVTDRDGNSRTCFAAYSMGNFVSGQRTKPREAGIIYNLYFDVNADGTKILSKITYIPTWVKFYENGSSLDIAVLPVYDVLDTSFWGGATGLSDEDLERVRQVHSDTTALITGMAIPLEDIRPEYEIYEYQEGLE